MKKGKQSFLIILSLLISLSGCNNKKEDNIFKPILDSNAKLSLNVIGFFGNFEALDQITNDFNEYYPNIDFNYQQVSSNNLKDYLDSNPQTDIFMTSSDFSVDNLNNYCLDLASANINLIDIDENILSSVYVNDNLYSIPIGQFVTGIVANLTLLAKENLQMPKNYQEFLNCLKVLKEKGYTPIQGPESKVLSQLTINMMADIIQTTPSLKENESQALEKITAIFNKIETIITSGYIDDNINQTYPYDNYDQAILNFFKGDVPFWVCDSEKVSGMKKRESKSTYFKDNPFEYSFFFSPIGENGCYAYHEPWYGFSVSKTSPSIEYAKEFMRFLTTKDSLNKLADIKGIPSIAKDAITSSIYANIINPSNVELECKANGTVSSNIAISWYSYVNQYAKKTISKEEAVEKFIQSLAD